MLRALSSVQRIATSSSGLLSQRRRALGAIRWHGPGVSSDAKTITITFLQGTARAEVLARVGESLLQTAHRNDIDLEGACEGVCACSTCHLILPMDLYGSLPEPSEDEEDMLEYVFCKFILPTQHYFFRPLTFPFF
jgi:ferredoxin